MSLSLTDLLALPFAGLSQSDKEGALFPLLADGVAYHRAHSPAFDRIARAAFPHAPTRLSDLPFLPISLFKNRDLLSVPRESVRVSVRSSGTTGAGSRIFMDADDARLTGRALAASLRGLCGAARLPMLIIDTPSTLKGGGDVGARAAAILGLMPFGRDPAFVLDDALRLDVARLRHFLAQYGGAPFLIYGFTFLVWQILTQDLGVDLSQGLLLHSGGWKKLTALAVDNATFHARLQNATGLRRIVNFYGMAETPGVVFLENADGFLYPPAFADVLVRDPVTLDVLPIGHEGLIQILNPLPRSYPGLSLLTEDMGLIEKEDAGADGWRGKALRLTRRAPRAELRGCSDVLPIEAA